MSDYLNIPNSKTKLKDGSVVMLRRFPGTKWLVHNGWYTYNGRNYTGWYFCSIPAQTVLPVSPQDLIDIIVVSDKDSQPVPEPPVPRPWPDPVPPMPPMPYPPMPGPAPQPPFYPYPPQPGPQPAPPGPRPYPDDKFGPNPFPPMPPMPLPDKPAFFGVKDKRNLDAAFITVPNITDLEAIDTLQIPDGKYVCVNSVDGRRKYFRWNRRDDKWDEIDPIAIIDEEIEDALEDYATREETLDKIDEIRQESRESVDRLRQDVEASTAVLDERITTNQTSIERLAATHASDVAEINDRLDDLEADTSEIDGTIIQINTRLDNIESAIFDIQKLQELSGDNTILVSDNGGIKDSGVGIGDDIIGEVADYADVHTVATERAVAELVERSQAKWTSFD